MAATINIKTTSNNGTIAILEMDGRVVRRFVGKDARVGTHAQRFAAIAPKFGGMLDGYKSTRRAGDTVYIEQVADSETVQAAAAASTVDTVSSSSMDDIARSMRAAGFSASEVAAALMENKDAANDDNPKQSELDTDKLAKRERKNAAILKSIPNSAMRERAEKLLKRVQKRYPYARFGLNKNHQRDVLKLFTGIGGGSGKDKVFAAHCSRIMPAWEEHVEPEQFYYSDRAGGGCILAYGVFGPSSHK